MKIDRNKNGRRQHAYGQKIEMIAPVGVGPIGAGFLFSNAPFLCGTFENISGTTTSGNNIVRGISPADNLCNENSEIGQCHIRQIMPELYSGYCTFYQVLGYNPGATVDNY